MRLSFVLSFLFIAQSYAQKPDWIRNAEMPLDSYGSVEAKRIAVHPDGSVFVIGQYRGSNTLNGASLIAVPDITIDDAFLAKYNANGDLLWVKQMFESEQWFVNRVIDIKVDHAGNLVFTGACFYPTSILGSAKGQGPFIAKMDRDANIIWVNFEPDVSLQGSDSGRRGNRIGFDPQHNILWYTDQIHWESFDSYPGGLAVLKYKPDGTKITNMFLTRNSTFYHPIQKDFSVDDDGNFIISGMYFFDLSLSGGPSLANNVPSPRVNPIQLFIAKFSPNGDFLWEVHSNYGGSCTTSAHMVDHDGNVYISVNLSSGARLYTGSGTYDSPGETLIAKLSPDGKILWKNRVVNGSASDFYLASDGLIYVSGTSYGSLRYQSYYYSGEPGRSDAFVLKLNSNGYFYGALHGAAVDNPATPYGSSAEADQSIVDTEGNIYTMGAFWEGLNWGCVPATTIEYSFFLVKHTPIESPIRTIRGPGQICDGTPITLTTDLVSNAVLYKWFTPDGPDPDTGTLLQNAITMEANSLFNKQPVIVSITDNCDEYFAEPYILNVPPPPLAPELLNSKDFVCPGTSEEISVTEIDSQNSFNWVLPAGITSPGLTANGGTLIFDNAFTTGNVKVTAFNACGSADLQFTIDTYKKPAVPVLDGNETICPGFNYIQKSINPVTDALSYQWELPPFVIFDPLFPQDNTTLNANVLPQFQSGEIKVRAVGHCEVSELSSAIVVNRFGGVGETMPLVGPDEICTGDHEIIRYSIPPIQNATAYYWNIPDLFASQAQITTYTPYIDLSVASAGSGDILVYGMDQCMVRSDTAVLSIEAYDGLPTPLLTISECDKELMVKGEGKFDWYLNGTHSTATNGDHLIVSDSGVYYVEVNNFCGIKQSNSITAHPLIPSNLLIPNVITPNGDGDNDFFQLDKALKDSSIRITNRWGNEIYSSPHYQNNWSAEGLSSGHYFYILHNDCLTVPYKGTILVIR